MAFRQSPFIDNWRTSVSILLLGVAPPAFFARTYVSGDSVALIESATYLRRCIAEGQLNGCIGANQFGFVQHLLAWIVELRWGDNTQSIGVLGLVSGVSFVLFVGILLACLRLFRMPRELFLALFLSPVLLYASTTFSEMMILSCGAVWMLAIYSQNPSFALLAGSLVVSSRESMILVLLPIALAAAVSGAKQLRILISAPWTLGVILMLGFNLLKYGTVRSPVYFQPELRVTDLSDAISFSLGVLVSPSGGLLVFWPLFATVVPLLFRSFVRPELSERIDVNGRDALRYLTVGVVFSIVAQIFGAAMWFAPFGWVSWGPRLAFPGVAVSLMLFAASARKAVGCGLAARELNKPEGLTRREAACASILGFVSTVFMCQFAISGPTNLISRFFSPRDEGPCTRVVNVLSERDLYFECLNWAIWDIGSSQLATVGREVRFPSVALGGIALVSTWTFLRAKNVDSD